VFRPNIERHDQNRRWLFAADQGHGQQHLPSDEVWLIGEHRMSGEKKYYLTNLPAKTDLRILAVTI
jgi:hypothetical protein